MIWPGRNGWRPGGATMTASPALNAGVIEPETTVSTWSPRAWAKASPAAVTSAHAMITPVTIRTAIVAHRRGNERVAESAADLKADSPPLRVRC